MFLRPNSFAQMRRSLKQGLFFAFALVASFPLYHGLVQAENKQADLPFWPNFPETLKVIPTGVDIQHQSGRASGIKVLGEGPGFVLIAQSDKSMIFATPPRLAPAWQVECELISCDLKRIASHTKTVRADDEEGLGRAAYQAALTFVALYTGFNENMPSRQIEAPQLPDLSNFRGDVSMTTPHQQTPLSRATTLLQGFQ